MIGPCLPYAAPSDAGAVRHDMFLDAHALGIPDCCFFVEYRSAIATSSCRTAAPGDRAAWVRRARHHSIDQPSATSGAASLDGEPTETYKGFPVTAGRIANCSW